MRPNHSGGTGGTMVGRAIPGVIFYKLISIFIIAIIFEIFIYLKYKNFNNFYYYMKGVSIVVDPPIATVGDRRPGETVDIDQAVWNFSGIKVSIIGAKSSCSCITTERLPLSLASGERRTVHVRAKMGPETGKYEQSVIFYTDCPRQTTFSVTVKGRVLPRQ